MSSATRFSVVKRVDAKRRSPSIRLQCTHSMFDVTHLVVRLCKCMWVCPEQSEHASQGDSEYLLRATHTCTPWQDYRTCRAHAPPGPEESGVGRSMSVAVPTASTYYRILVASAALRQPGDVYFGVLSCPKRLPQPSPLQQLGFVVLGASHAKRFLGVASPSCIKYGSAQ